MTAVIDRLGMDANGAPSPALVAALQAAAASPRGAVDGRPRSIAELAEPDDPDGQGSKLGKLVTVVSGTGDDAERSFSANLAHAYTQTGKSTLLIDCVPNKAALVEPQIPTHNLADLVENRLRIDRSWMANFVSRGTSPVPVIAGGPSADRIARGELLEFLSIVLGIYDTVVFSMGGLHETRLLGELLPISVAVQVLTTQDRAAIRTTQTILLQADPARRWRERMNLVVDGYDASLVPTAAQISDVTGVVQVTPLPMAPEADFVELSAGMAGAPYSLDTVYGSTVFKIAVAEESQKPRPKLDPSVRMAIETNIVAQAGGAAASRMAIGFTFAYLVLAVPVLMGTDVLTLLGRQLRVIGQNDLAWAGILWDALFLTANALLVYFLVRRYLRQRDGTFDQLKALTEHSLAGIAFTDDAGIIRYANPVFRRLLNLSHGTIDSLRLDAVLASRMGGVDPRELLNSVGEGRANIKVKSGSQQEVDLALSARRIRLPNANLGWVVNVQDITAGRAYRESTAISSSALEVAADGIMVADLSKPNFPLVYVNKAFEDITGYSRREAVGKNPRFLQGNDRLQPEIAALSRAIKQRKSLTVTLRNYRKDGTLFWNQMRLAPVLDQHGRATHYVAIQRDVTAQRQAAEQMEQLAYLDTLTSLPNRVRFKRQLTDMMAADSQRKIIVARVDVKHLHDVNTSAGYERGDALLIQVAARLRMMFPVGVIGRLTGDEFAVAYQHDPDHAPDAMLVKLRDRLLQRYDLPGISLHVTFAMGYTVADGISAETAIRQAAVAAHDAKAAGLAEIRSYDPATESIIRTRARMTAEMQQSLGTDDFEMHYQPKVDLATGAMVGAEALVRWQHPVFGLQRPDRFIPLAEQTGLIVELGAMVFAKSVKMAARINSGGREIIPISVNVSAFQFRQAGLMASFEKMLADAHCEASWVTLELTESVFTDSSAELVAKLHALRARGFGLSIDDFGTGYSSLRYLQNFPLTEIKLDRSFVTNLDQNAYNRAIAEAVLTIGQGLNVSVVAEGIENDAERRVLLSLGCRNGQGFLFSKPISADAFLALVGDTSELPWHRTFHA